MMFNQLIHELERRIGIRLAIDDTETCMVAIDAMVVRIQHLPEIESLCIWGVIGEPPPQNLSRLLSAMLEANHFYSGTGGATISRDSESGKFCLFRILGLHTLDGEGFVGALERFVNTLEAWIALLRDYRDSSAQDAPHEDEGHPFLSKNGFLSV